MDDRLNSSGSYEGNISLHTYVHDHAAGAQQAVQLLRTLSDHHGGTALHGFAADLLEQVEEDLATLENLSTKIGADGFQAKEFAGWLADQLSRLKLSPLDEPFHVFEALEFLSLGILGKRALWRALASVAVTQPKLAGINYDELLQRAETQYGATERMRLQLAAQAFG